MTNEKPYVPNLSPGVTVEYLDDAVSKRFVALQQGHEHRMVRFQPYHQVYPESFVEFERTMKELEVRDDDIWVSTFPKCGEWRCRLKTTSGRESSRYSGRPKALCTARFSHSKALLTRAANGKAIHCWLRQK